MQILNSQEAAQANAAALTGGKTTAAQNSGAASGRASASSANGSGTSQAAISANDFLTLLVTEMKHQDPTANTDPNQYINQLVQVNNLQQLISINQGVGVLDAASGSGRPGSPSPAASASNALTAVTEATSSGADSSGTAQSVKPASAGIAAAGQSVSPAQTISNFAAALRGEPAAAPSRGAAMAASAKRVASAL